LEADRSSQFINPSVRGTILTGLLYPMDYVNSGDDTRAAENPELWQLPDTSILFRRYLNSGKMINVYDWYESFAVVLDDQRRRTRKKGKSSPTKSASPRKRKKKGALDDDDQNGEEEEEEEESPGELEKWRMEVQARFIRAVHELDYLGFIKHTGRKADHVLRTVFEVED
jgi:origin recognition complex subunit 3